MSRKRIVIDLESPAGAPADVPTARTQISRTRKRRRWPKVVAILLVLALLGAAVAALGGFLWWQRHASTPAYSLALMIDAAQRGDVTEFQKRLNEDEIAKNMATAVSQKAAARYGLALSNTVKQQIDSTMPSLLQELKPAIREEVTKEIQAFASKSKPQPFILLVVAVPSLMTIESRDDAATASGMLNDRRIEMLLKRGNGGWVVTDFKDDVVTQRIVDRVMAQLPAIGQLDAKLPLLKPGKRPQRRK